MICGIGCDIVEIARLKDELKQKILSVPELEVYGRFTSDTRKQEFLAGRFAIKEAIIKALGPVSMPELIILDDEAGKPHLSCARFNELKIHISLSHERVYAVGFCIAETLESGANPERRKNTCK
jgi:holo-[acyl-carrier protein] synthase